MSSQKQKKYYKLTKSQQTEIFGMCFTVEPKKTLQNVLVPLALFVERDFNSDSMEKAFNCLLSRTDALRLQISLRPGGLRQTIAPYEAYQADRITLRDSSDFSDYSLKYCSRLSLFSKKLYKANLVSFEAGGGGIIICLHHIISDGYTADLLAEKLIRYYEVYKAGGEPPSEKNYSITNYFDTERAYLKSKQFKEDRKYWFRQYNSQPRYSFPAGRIPWRSNISVEALTLNSGQYTQLQSLCKSLSCSLPSLVMSLSALVVNALHGDENFCFYSIQHGRIGPALKKTAGCMYNMFPVFYNLQKEQTVTDYLSGSYMQYLEALSHGRFPVSHQILMAAKETYMKRFGYNHMWCIFSNMGQGFPPHQEFKAISMQETYLMGMFYCGLFDHPESSSLRIELTYQNCFYSSAQIRTIFQTFLMILEAVDQNPADSLRQTLGSLRLSSND